MQKATFDFLRDLKKNNKKQWFDANRDRYEAARADFLEFTEELIKELTKIEPGLKGLKAKDCMFRINRDVRFSKDKTPYKTNLGAEIKVGGRKSRRSGFFIKVGPGGQTALAGGMHELDSKMIGKIREKIAKDAGPLRKIVEARAFVKEFGPLHGERLKTAPKGFPKDHPDLDLLQLKGFFAVREFSDKEALGKDFLKAVVSRFKAIKPLNDYLNAAIAVK